MHKTKVSVTAELKDNFFHVRVEEFPGLLAICRSRQNVAKAARDAISEHQGIPVSRIQVMKVQVS